MFWITEVQSTALKRDGVDTIINNEGLKYGARVISPCTKTRHVVVNPFRLLRVTAAAATIQRAGNSGPNYERLQSIILHSRFTRVQTRARVQPT